MGLILHDTQDAAAGCDECTGRYSHRKRALEVTE